MKNLLNCQAHIYELAHTVLLNSGRGIQHRGHYYDCIEDNRMKYALVELGYKDTPFNIFTGLCLPKQCSDALITNTFNSAFKAAKQPVSVYSIDSATQDYHFELTWVSYLTIFILLTIATLCFVATVRYYSLSNKKDKKNRWLECFNIKTNIREHFQVRQNQSLNIWDGVRALAMMWVVFGHSFSFILATVVNLLSAPKFASKPFYLILEAGILSVDVFFSLGGFFLAFIMLRHAVTLKICGLAILQRALRIWPAYIIAMLFYYSLFLKTNSGLFWAQQEAGVVVCKTMWEEVLFLSNFINNTDTMCMGWGWYLQVDFQLFVAGVFLVYLSTYSRKISYFTNLFLCILSCIYVYIWTYRNDIHTYADISTAGGQNAVNYQWYIYIKPYGRCVVYFMGVYFGSLYMDYRAQIKQNPENRETLLGKVKERMQVNRILRIGVEWTGIALMAFVTFIPRTVQVGMVWPQALNSLYMTFSKPLFILGMFLTVLPSMIGFKHSFFNLILNTRLFVFIARISFCTYLLHINFLIYFESDRSYDIYYSIIDQFMIYMGLLVICLFFGAIMTITIQVPFGKMVKMMFAQVKVQKAKAKQEASTSILTNDSITEALTAAESPKKKFQQA